MVELCRIFPFLLQETSRKLRFLKNTGDWYSICRELK